MIIQEIAEKLNITSYPDALNKISNWDSIPDISNIQWIIDIEDTYHILGKYRSIIYEAVRELQQDKNRFLWGMTVAKYLTICSVPEVREIPIPPRDGTLIGDFLPLLILLTQLPACIEESRRRNMPEDMIRRNLDHIVDGISIVEKQTGTPAINLTYFRWLVKFFKVTLFNFNGFNFEIRALPSNIFLLQNVTDRTLFPVLHNTNIHCSGNVLNSAGCTDTEDSFYVQFTETDDLFIAHPCINGRVQSEPKTFPKSQYQLILQPGSTVLSVHIPRGTDISPQNATACLLAGFKEALRLYPELDIKALYCHSWLLDPQLKELLRSGANIPQFGELFTRFPAKSAGAEVFSFVFPKLMPLHDLPENTNLERALKKHYLSGKYILAYSGITLPNML